MANFWSKNIFYKTNIEDGQKVHRKGAPLITICFFLTKKKKMQNFWDFWGFLKFRDLVAKSEIGT